jgi:hypothetical protein
MIGVLVILVLFHPAIVRELQVRIKVGAQLMIARE